MKRPTFRANNPMELEAVTRALYAAGYTRYMCKDEAQGVQIMLEWDHGAAYVYTNGSQIGRMRTSVYLADANDYVLVNSPAQMVAALKRTV